MRSVHPDFSAFVSRKEQAAAAANLEPFETIVDRSAAFALDTISFPFADRLLDGPFFQSPVSSGPLPSLNLVFVQSREGNTAADDPATLGGGETDKHIIYEGLSRVAADGVLAGSKTVEDGNSVFSVWHPELVSLRRRLGKSRHPVQIVVTAKGALPIEEGGLFNVPEVQVVLLSAGAAAQRLEERTASRPWIRVISSGERSDIRCWMERLWKERGIQRISAVGGRTTATALIDAGLIQDLYLTTGPVSAGTPDTPLYCGTHPPHPALVVRKQSPGGVVFEHFVLR